MKRQSQRIATDAVEITTFRLIDGLTMQDFVDANHDIDAWLRDQPGFVSRRICARDDGHVVDVLVWTSVDAAHRAAAGVVTEMAHSPVHAAIDQSTVNWTIAPVHHTLNQRS
jgi:antibiotic biosynthesis monooxygenase (ABM) superfamily enzyme